MAQETPDDPPQIELSEEQIRALLEQGREELKAVYPRLQAAVRVRPEDLQFVVK